MKLKSLKLLPLKTSEDKIYAMNATILKQPSIYKKAMKSSEKSAWLNAINNEIEAMHENQVWTLVDRPESSNNQNSNIIDSRWVLTIKEGRSGEKLHKARLVTRGFQDKNDYGLDENYAPIAQVIRALLV